MNDATPLHPSPDALSETTRHGPMSDRAAYAQRVTKLSRSVSDLSTELYDRGRHDRPEAVEAARRLNLAWVQLNRAWLALHGVDEDGQPLEQVQS